MKNIAEIKKMINSQTIRKGLVNMCYFEELLGETVLLLDFKEFKGIIMKDELDEHVEFKNMGTFVGREILYTVKSVDEVNKIVYCSRKEAQILKRPVITEALENGEVLRATFANILSYGAYLEIEGIPVFMRNKDFSDDYTPISEVKSIGDVISVTLQSMVSEKNIDVQAVSKFKSKTVLDFSLFERGQVIVGTITNVLPDRAYVNIAPNLDAMCPIPLMDIQEGLKVQFKIKTVKADDKKVRGVITRVL